jgi:hypothetical protein
MDPLERCLQVLWPLVQASETNGIVLAERAIDEFLAAPAHEGSNRQTGALNILERHLIDVSRGASGASADFAETVIQYVEAKARNLRPNP